jgi:hypothetical protein
MPPLSASVQRLECHRIGYSMPSNASPVHYCRVVERHCSLFDLHFEGGRVVAVSEGRGGMLPKCGFHCMKQFYFTYYLIKGVVRRNSSVDIVTKQPAGHAS